LSSLGESVLFSSLRGSDGEEGDGMTGELRRVRRRVGRKGMGVLLFAAVLTVLGVADFIAAAGQPAASAPAKTDAQRLVGRWVRPDGGYVLEVREVTKDGSLKVTYFNPRPINVARAEWKQKDGLLTVFVELRDVNYPGSTYTLQYDVASDRLIGKYFQAVEKQTFAIEFARIR
jgi:hypothetical protein